MSLQNAVEETTKAAETVSDREPGVTLLEILIIVARRKRMVIRFTLGGAVIAILVSLLLPNIYTGRTKILPPQQSQSIATAFLGQLGPLASLAGKDFVRSPNDTYVEMLQSQTVLESMVRRLHLVDAYREKSIGDAVDQLRDVTRISTSKAGMISIEVDDKDPNRAAQIANAYVEELFKITQELAVSEASQRRVFFDKQRKNALDDLSKAESELKATQESTGLIQLDSQAKAIIESVSVVRAQIVAKEVQLHSMRSFGTEQNPDIIRAENELAGLRVQLANLQTRGNGGGDTQIPTRKIPEAGLEYIRKLRDVKYYETVFELLAKQFELAKLDESRDAAIIQVLDKAVAPVKKSKPQRSVIVLLAMLVAMFLGVIWSLLLEFSTRIKADPEFELKLQGLVSDLGANRG